MAGTEHRQKYVTDNRISLGEWQMVNIE
jgi:hypothetical protein